MIWYQIIHGSLYKSKIYHEIESYDGVKSEHLYHLQPTELQVYRRTDYQITLPSC